MAQTQPDFQKSSAAQSFPSGSRLAGQLAALAPDLRAISTTTDDQRQLIQLFLQTTMTRSSMLGIAWVQFQTNSDLEIVDSQFRNASVQDGPFQKELLEIACRVNHSKSSQLIKMKRVHGANAMGVPIHIDANTTAVVCGFSTGQQTGTNDLALVLSLIAAHFDNWRGRTELTVAASEVRNTAAILELVGKTQCCETVRKAGQTIVNELKEFFQCDYVAIGLQRKKRKLTMLVALSSHGEFERNSTTAASFENAFEESIVRETYTVYPPRDESHRTASLAHKKLCTQLNAESAITVPLRGESNSTVGAITIVGSYSIDRNEWSRNLLHGLDYPLGNAMQAVKSAEGGPLRKLRRVVASRRNNQVLYWSIALCFLAVATLFAPVTYRVSGGFTAEPVLRQYTVAPHDGLLLETFVQPGDTVESGQLLAQMDGHEIRLEMGSLEAEREKAIKQRDRFKAGHRNSDELIAENERLKINAKYQVLTHRESNLELRSPTDGIVLSGSIDRRANFPVSVGQSLYEIAPIDQLRIEIAIADDQVMHVKKGQQIKLRFDGFGTETINSVVDRIRPNSTIRNSRNVFIVEAVVTNQSQNLRPGMKGTAQVYTDVHALGWNLFHLPWEKFVTAIGF